MKVSGNDLFVTAMKKEGVDTIFAYPIDFLFTTSL